MRGLLAGLADADREDLLDRLVTAALAADDLVRLLVAAPFRAPTWRRLELQDPAIRERYWREAVPDHGPYTPDERATLIDRLLEVGRPTAAFAAVHLDLDEIDTGRLGTLLEAIATIDAEPAVRRWPYFEIVEALRILAARPGVTPDQLARLEWRFLDELERCERGIPNLECAVTDVPLTFVHVLALACPRDDGGEDPPEWHPDDPAHRDAAARRARSLLERLRRMPGTRADGTIDGAQLTAWIQEVRRLCRAHGRAARGDRLIGELLARAPADPDGTWPCRAVAQALDALGTDALARGFRMGVDKPRVMVARGEDGAQERDLAARYRARADAHRFHFHFPFTATLLDELAATYEREAAAWDRDGIVRRRLAR